MEDINATFEFATDYWKVASNVETNVSTVAKVSTLFEKVLNHITF